jgi:hypothetical protein
MATNALYGWYCLIRSPGNLYYWSMLFKGLMSQLVSYAYLALNCLIGIFWHIAQSRVSISILNMENNYTQRQYVAYKDSLYQLPHSISCNHLISTCQWLIHHPLDCVDSCLTMQHVCFFYQLLNIILFCTWLWLTFFGLEPSLPLVIHGTYHTANSQHLLSKCKLIQAHDFHFKIYWFFSNSCTQRVIPPCQNHLGYTDTGVRSPIPLLLVISLGIFSVVAATAFCIILWTHQFFGLVFLLFFLLNWVAACYTGSNNSFSFEY